MVGFWNLPTNIRQGWKWIEVANALAYYDMATITTVKSFIVQAPGHRCYYTLMEQHFFDSSIIIEGNTENVYKFHIAV
jgi:hypothetical protein